MCVRLIFIPGLILWCANRNSTDRISNAAYLRLLPCGEILPPSIYYHPNNYPFPQFFISTNPCYVKGTSSNDSILIKGLSLYTYNLFYWYIYRARLHQKIFQNFSNTFPPDPVVNVFLKHPVVYSDFFY